MVRYAYSAIVKGSLSTASFASRSLGSEHALFLIIPISKRDINKKFKNRSNKYVEQKLKD